MSKSAALLAAACAMLALWPAAAHAVSAPAAMQTVALPAALGPVDNPLKGWCPWATGVATHQPYSMAYCDTPWKALEPAEGQYDFAGWEMAKWDSPVARGKHVVLRVWVDYPNASSGMPDWLIAKGVRMTPYDDAGIGKGMSPDYDNPAMLGALLRLIAAMGKRYDHNPRVAFIELGLLGHWGEWHDYPHPELFASDATQQRVIDAFRAVFPDKILEARTAGGYAGRQAWLGYHDDLFPQDTDGSEDWKFLPTIRASGRANNWQGAAIGGEMEPGDAKTWLGSGFSRYRQTIREAHATWNGPYCPAQEASDSPEFVANSQTAVREMGYEYRLTSVTLPTAVKRGSELRITLTGENQGVAPFYYPWPVRFALISTAADHRVAQTIPLATDLRDWQPGPATLTVGAPLSVPPGRYGIAVGIIDPYTGKPAIKFANALPTAQGWTVLGHVTVRR